MQKEKDRIEKDISVEYINPFDPDPSQFNAETQMNSKPIDKGIEEIFVAISEIELKMAKELEEIQARSQNIDRILESLQD